MGDLGSREAEALAEEARIRAAYRRPDVWLAHRLANRFGLAALRSLPDGGERLRAAVKQSGTTLRPYKVLILSRLLRNARPGVVVEYGGGASTFLIAEILDQIAREGGPTPRFYSLEQSEDYAQRIEQAMPAALKPSFELIRSAVKSVDLGGYRAVHYVERPQVDHIDFAFIDGPAPIGSETPFSGDFVLEVQRGTRVALAATDVRLFNAMFFRDLVGDRFDVRVNVHGRTVLSTPRKA